MNKKITWEIRLDLARPGIDRFYPDARVVHLYAVGAKLAGKKVFLIRFAANHVPGNSHKTSWNQLCTDPAGCRVSSIIRPSGAAQEKGH